MKHLRALIPTLAAFAVASLLGGCRGKSERANAAPETWKPPGGSVVETARVERVAPGVAVVGTVKSEQEITLGARLQAPVTAVYARAGERVTNGQVLAMLDDREWVEQLAAAEAQLKQAASDQQRAQRLFEQGASSEQVLTAANAAFEFGSAQAERLRVLLTYTRIVSPIDGVVIDRNVDAGDLVSPGQALLSLFDPALMQLEAAVPGRLAARMTLGQEAEITIDGRTDIMTGRVAEVLGAIDPATRTRTVRFTIAGDAIAPGSFGRVRVEDEARDAITLPETSVLHFGQLDMVRVASGGDTVSRLVKTGEARHGRIEILAGIAEGDLVVVPLAESP